MADTVLIPMFPLTLLPLPGELVPLHIFEERYRQLFREAEDQDISFGIFFTSDINTNQLGSLMKLERVIKRYPGGESDVITKCTGIFTMTKLYRTFRNKLYPGGDVVHHDAGMSHFPGEELHALLAEYFLSRNLSQANSSYSLPQIANELNLDILDRHKFLTASPRKQETFLVNKLKFLIRLLEQEKKSKDVYHLN